MGSRRLPAREWPVRHARDRRPGSLKITSSCASPGCFTVTLTAKPRKTVVTLEIARAWEIDASKRIEEKLDGRFATAFQSLGGAEKVESILAGELMRGEFFAFDILNYRGKNVTLLPLRMRIPLMEEICSLGGFRRVRVMGGGTSPGEFLDEILAAGGEGIVIKDLDAPYGDMLAAKRLETWICRVTGGNGGSQSVRIEDAGTWQDRGRVALFSGKCDQVCPGSLIKVEGFGLTKAGKIREPRPCKDSATSWLVKF
jgi:hypothetical protein